MPGGRKKRGTTKKLAPRTKSKVKGEELEEPHMSGGDGYETVAEEKVILQG